MGEVPGERIASGDRQHRTVSKRALGQRAERQAERYLSRQGLRVVKRNYRCRLGEIDLVMHEGDTLVFVEVRLRGRTTFGDGIDSVSLHKQRRLIRAARHFLMRNLRWRHAPCRFDVIGIERASDHVTWIPNAFQADS